MADRTTPLSARLRELEDDVAMGHTSDRAIQNHLIEAAEEIERLHMVVKRALSALDKGDLDPHDENNGAAWAKDILADGLKAGTRSQVFNVIGMMAFCLDCGETVARATGSHDPVACSCGRTAV